HARGRDSNKFLIHFSFPVLRLAPLRADTTAQQHYAIEVKRRARTNNEEPPLRRFARLVGKIGSSKRPIKQTCRCILKLQRAESASSADTPHPGLLNIRI